MTLYAFVNGGQIHQTTPRLPDTARRLADGKWVSGLREYGDRQTRESCGWYEVVETPSPPDTATHTFVYSVVLVSGVPTVTWTQRAFTVDELAGLARQANLTALTDVQVLAAKIAEIKTFLTDPDVVAAEAQPNATALTAQQQNRFNKAVARQLRRSANIDVRLFRYVFGQLHPELLDDISDT
jgi:hypothetical protein